tara:strand:+ start:1725 stop:2039 length:315 start_codon:yes stop_codon:yes gene_type:complete
MIQDQLNAYRCAVETRAKAEVNWYNEDADITEVRACREEEQLRLDGLQSVIGMAIREYAAREPCNPFAINGDVNQPSSLICNNTIMSEPKNEHGTFPPPPKPRD